MTKTATKTNNVWDEIYTKLVRQTIFPLIMMVITPNAAMLLPHIIVNHNASLVEVYRKHSLSSILFEAWSNVNLIDLQCWSIIIVSLVFGYSSIRFLPGRKYHGPPALNNFRPVYYD